MKCVRCGYTKRGNEEDFICDDCNGFYQILDDVWFKINSIFNQPETTINPEIDQVLKLLADTAFVTEDNPQSRIFYKLTSMIIDRALKSKMEITETELNREIRTVRNWKDTLKIFEELELIRVKTEKYERIIIIEEKPRWIAMAWMSGEPLENELLKRTILIFTGYILLYVMYKTNRMVSHDDILMLPYKQRPRTLWNTIMILWTMIDKGDENITEYDIDRFLGRRGVPLSTTIKIKAALGNYYKDQTGLIKDVEIVNGERIYKFADYALIEMERLRKDRMRERGGR